MFAGSHPTPPGKTNIMLHGYACGAAILPKDKVGRHKIVINQ